MVEYLLIVILWILGFASTVDNIDNQKNSPFDYLCLFVIWPVISLTAIWYWF